MNRQPAFLTALPHSIPNSSTAPTPTERSQALASPLNLPMPSTNQLVEDGKLSAGKIDLKRYLDLVALGTIADMATLLGENRILVRYGLRQLRKTKRIGLAKLCILSEVKLSEITPLDIASKVAPRLNSLGRIADPNKGVQLLLCRDSAQAEGPCKRTRTAQPRTAKN